jgi:hypothetical protein
MLSNEKSNLFALFFSSPCQRQCELLPSLGVRRPLTSLIFHLKAWLFKLTSWWYYFIRFSWFMRNIYRIYIMKRQFKQWWLTIPPISTKQKITSHHKDVAWPWIHLYIISCPSVHKWKNRLCDFSFLFM